MPAFRRYNPLPPSSEPLVEGHAWDDPEMVLFRRRHKDLTAAGMLRKRRAMDRLARMRPDTYRVEVVALAWDDVRYVLYNKVKNEAHHTLGVDDKVMQAWGIPPAPVWLTFGVWKKIGPTPKE
jgi:hypothetical protein